MLCALIMAGGRGTRFWPKSTEEKPKQFLNLVGNKTMLQLTFDRVNRIIDKEHIFVCTSRDYKDLVKEQLNIEDSNIILEPCGRNTAPCILLSSLYINSIYPNSNIVSVPSDHIINDEDKFLEDIKNADEFINNKEEAIITLGIKPSRPETDYGYIKYDSTNKIIEKVERFVEKPNYDLAVQYYKDGSYLWNAGIFIFNTTKMNLEFSKYMEYDYNLLNSLPFGTNEFYSRLDGTYEKCTKVSIDYAIMEKSSNVYTIPTDIGWDDIGSWKAIERYISKDENDNVIKGNIEVDNSKNNIIYGNNKKIILLDINDIFCIDSDDVIIIGKKDSITKVHNLKDKGVK